MPLPRLSRFRLRSSRSRTASKPEAKGPPKTAAQKFLHNWVLPLALAFAILTPIRSSIADWNDVPSGSMRPTILEGDRIYVNKLAYGLRVPFTTMWVARWDEPKRGEIVTFKSPADGQRLVKRIIGLPGDRIELRGNRLVINGRMASYSTVAADVPMHLSDGQRFRVVVEEESLPPSLTSDPPEGVECDDQVCRHALSLVSGARSDVSSGVWTVPAGHYFMMGDNRDLSRDSRMIGFVPVESIYGRSSYVALSVDPEESYMPRFGRWFSRMK
ncbi:MAG: signal peptidase I [Phycisphaerales bacterium]|nr:signal peptidase I [Phycisphaerales bacterium]